MIDPALLKSRITALKRFKIKDCDESNYINSGFYTNKIIFIVDPFLSNIDEEQRVFDSSSEYKALDRELIKKLENFNSDNRNYREKIFDKSSFKTLVTELKKFGMEQIRIHPDGTFECYDKTGHLKWEINGKWEGFKDLELDCDNKIFQDILNYMIAAKVIEIKIKTDKKFLLVEGTGGIKALYRGTIFKGDFENGYTY